MIRRSRQSKVFTTPPYRAAFNALVWDIVSRIPRGKVLTYGTIGALIPRPRGIRAAFYKAARARWVGSAMAACPEELPWHRVINSQGKISLRTENNHHVIQRRRLEQEGLRFNHRGAIDLDEYLWHPDERRR